MEEPPALDADDDDEGGEKASSLSLTVTPESCSSSRSPHLRAHSSTALESTHWRLGAAHSSSASQSDMARVCRDRPRPRRDLMACSGPLLLLVLLLEVLWAWSRCRIMCTRSPPPTRPSWSGVGVTTWRAGEPMLRHRDTSDDHWLSTRRRNLGDPGGERTR